mgnify:FL=1|jgi:Tautomerase enzyme.
MPLTRISIRKGKSPAYKRALFDALYTAMREAFNVPDDDRFMTISEHDVADFDYGRHYLGIDRSDDLVLIQLTVSDTRTLEQKQALFARICALLGEDPGVRPEDVFINLVEVRKENWSFGHGQAQYA